MSDESSYRVSEGVLIAPFLDGAAVVDLVEERTHVVGPAAAWLLMQDPPTPVDRLVEDAAPTDRDATRAAVLGALDELRSLGLVDRTVTYEFPEPPGDSTAPRLGGHTGVTHAVVGRRIAFRCDDPELLARVDAFLGGGIDVDATRFFDIVPHEDGITLLAADRWDFADEDQLLRTLPVVCNDDAARTPDIAVIHTGTVRTPDGRVVMLMGDSNSGKSTLTAALVAAGCDYLGDESVGIGSDGSVEAYPKPLTLDAGSRAVLGLSETDFPHTRVDEIRRDTTAVTNATGVDEILVVRYDPAHTGPCSARPLDPIPALHAVIDNVLNLARGGETGLTGLCELVERVPVVPFTHPGVDVAVPVVLGA